MVLYQVHTSVHLKSIYKNLCTQCKYCIVNTTLGTGTIGTDQKTYIYLFKRPATLNPALDIFLLFPIFVGSFALLDPDPDLATQINADPCGSGSETLNKTYSTVIPYHTLRYPRMIF